MKSGTPDRRRPKFRDETRIPVPVFGFLFGLALQIAAPSLALAFMPYFEAGAGISTQFGGSAFYGNSAAPFSDLAPNFRSGLFFTLSDGNAPLDIHFGVDWRESYEYVGALSYSSQIVYPAMRIQLSKLYLNFGASPWIWTRKGSGIGPFDAYTPFSGGMAYLGEVGLLYAITPKLTFGTAVSTQWISWNGQFSPAPTADLQGFLRFYFGLPSRSDDDRDSTSEYKGWRYPFGSPKD